MGISCSILWGERCVCGWGTVVPEPGKLNVSQERDVTIFLVFATPEPGFYCISRLSSFLRSSFRPGCLFSRIREDRAGDCVRGIGIHSRRGVYSLDAKERERVAPSNSK